MMTRIDSHRDVACESNALDVVNDMLVIHIDIRVMRVNIKVNRVIFARITIG